MAGGGNWNREKSGEYNNREVEMTKKQKAFFVGIILWIVCCVMPIVVADLMGSL